jgi:hypothetical protein
LLEEPSINNRNRKIRQRLSLENPLILDAVIADIETLYFDRYLFLF